MSCSLKKIKEVIESRRNSIDLDKFEKDCGVSDTRYEHYTNILKSLDKLFILEYSFEDDRQEDNIEEIIDNPPYYYLFTSLDDKKNTFYVEADFFITTSNISKVNSYFRKLLNNNLAFAVERVFDYVKSDYIIISNILEEV